MPHYEKAEPIPVLPSLTGAGSESDSINDTVWFEVNVDLMDCTSLLSYDLSFIDPTDPNHPGEGSESISDNIYQVGGIGELMSSASYVVATDGDLICSSDLSQPLLTPISPTSDSSHSPAGPGSAGSENTGVTMRRIRAGESENELIRESAELIEKEVQLFI